MSPCPPRHELDRLLDDGLPPDRRAGISAHVASCPDCQRTLESLTADPEIQAFLRRVRHDPIP